MKKKSLAVWTLLLLLFSLLFARVWILDDDGPSDFTSFEDMLEADTGSDTVMIKNGTYGNIEREYDLSGKRLIGENKDSVIIYTMGIISRHSRLKNLCFWGPDSGVGIDFVDRYDESKLEQVVIKHFYIGIRVAAAYGNDYIYWVGPHIVNCTVTNSTAGMYVKYVPYCSYPLPMATVHHSVFGNNKIAVLLGDSLDFWDLYVQVYLRSSWWGNYNIDSILMKVELPDSLEDAFVEILETPDSPHLSSPPDSSCVPEYGCNNFANNRILITTNPTASIQESAQTDDTHNGSGAAIMIGENNIEITLLPEFYPGGATVELYNIMGKLILQRHITPISSLIPTKDFPNGFYLVKVRGKNNSITRKCIIVK